MCCIRLWISQKHPTNVAAAQTAPARDGLLESSRTNAAKQHRPSHQRSSANAIVPLPARECSSARAIPDRGDPEAE